MKFFAIYSIIALSTLGSTLAKLPEGCIQSYTVVEADTCVGVAQKFGIPEADLYSMNPKLHHSAKHDCDNLDIGKEYCVCMTEPCTASDVPNNTTMPSPTAPFMTGAPSATPSAPLNDPLAPPAVGSPIGSPAIGSPAVGSPAVGSPAASSMPMTPTSPVNNNMNSMNPASPTSSNSGAMMSNGLTPHQAAQTMSSASSVTWNLLSMGFIFTATAAGYALF